MWKCSKCGAISQIGLAIGIPTCSSDGSQMEEFDKKHYANKLQPISVGGKVTVGGSMNNSGKIKVFDNGELNINKDLINTGDISISDPEKIKELLIEVIKTSGNLAELGSNIIKTFFNGRS